MTPARKQKRSAVDHGPLDQFEGDEAETYDSQSQVPAYVQTALLIQTRFRSVPPGQG